MCSILDNNNQVTYIALRWFTTWDIRKWRSNCIIRTVSVCVLMSVWECLGGWVREIEEEEHEKKYPHIIMEEQFTKIWLTIIYIQLYKYMVHSYTQAGRKQQNSMWEINENIYHNRIWTSWFWNKNPGRNCDTVTPSCARIMWPNRVSSILHKENGHLKVNNENLP